MRRPRFKALDHFDSGIYHCVSRVVDRRLVMGPEEKEQFVKLMRLYGLQAVTFCIMGNHFHILVEVPKRPEVLPCDDALVALVNGTKGKDEAFWLNALALISNEQRITSVVEKYGISLRGRRVSRSGSTAGSPGVARARCGSIVFGHIF